jgi:hypothetical protein
MPRLSPAVSLAPKLAFLKTPGAYRSEAAATLALRDERRGLQMKKPARHPYLGFSSPQRRHAAPTPNSY